MRWLAVRFGQVTQLPASGSRSVLWVSNGALSSAVLKALSSASCAGRNAGQWPLFASRMRSR
jgi:hypothetical protein